MDLKTIWRNRAAGKPACGVGMKGFTLIEIMLAIVVLGVGLLAMGSMQITAVNGNTHAFRMNDAAILAQNTVERLMILPYGAAELSDENPDNSGGILRCPLPPLGSGCPQIPDPDGTLFREQGVDCTKYEEELGVRPVQVQNGKYTIYWNIADNFPAPNTKTINVIVTWMEGGSPHAILLETVKSMTSSN
ncbi:MAG: prepilin-type N-terminal cleavage/methylation domain-containing protein [Deltaproteobacteria bacterium]|nr:prepilin-type N-terminal cleavage/methylation domain-containing protein [Deltaproteobacteria bacterium]